MSRCQNVKVFLKILLWTVLVCLCQPAIGDVVTAEGRSPLGGDLQTARKNAYEDAVRNALRKAGSRVDSSTTVNNGILVSDRVNLRALGQVSDVEVLDEYQHEGFYVVSVRAVVADGRNCQSARSAHYHKDVLFTGFPREQPEVAQVGRLDNVDADFATALSQRLYPSYQVLVQNEPSVLLASRTRYGEASLQVSEFVKKLAAKYQVQLVVSGSIVDMSMLYPHDYFRQASAETAMRKVGSMFGGKNRDSIENNVRARNFSFRLMIYDGLSGSPIFDKTYTDVGIWDARYTEVTGFGSPRFWKTGYGQVVSSLMDTAVDELGQKINCQPFMVPVKLQGIASNQSLHVLAGANHGVKVGDTFELAQRNGENLASLNNVSDMVPYPAEYRSLQTDGAVMTITQVYPTYSIGKPGNALKSGHHYMAIVW